MTTDNPHIIEITPDMERRVREERRSGTRQKLARLEQGLNLALLLLNSLQREDLAEACWCKPGMKEHSLECKTIKVLLQAEGKRIEHKR